jgi:hypothetical protein
MTCMNSQCCSTLRITSPGRSKRSSAAAPRLRPVGACCRCISVATQDRQPSQASSPLGAGRCNSWCHGRQPEMKPEA